LLEQLLGPGETITLLAKEKRKILTKKRGLYLIGEKGSEESQLRGKRRGESAEGGKENLFGRNSHHEKRRNRLAEPDPISRKKKKGREVKNGGQGMPSWERKGNPPY